MAANYWDSSQRRYWTFTKPQLADMRQEIEDEDRTLFTQHPLPDQRLLNVYISQQLGKLGKRMSVRQQAIATAMVYIKRYYLKVDIRRTNPYLVLSTAFYLACKMEECPQHIRLVVGEARQFWPDVLSSETSKLGECEFSLISEMNSQLIVHHPYRSLTELQTEFGLTSEEMALAWSTINDHYLTDLPLLYPPHIIAITAIILAVFMKPSQGTVQPHASGLQSIVAALAGTTGVAASSNTRIQKLINWIAESGVDIPAMMDCVQEIISLYDLWEHFNEKACKEHLTKIAKARMLDR